MNTVSLDRFGVVRGMTSAQQDEMVADFKPYDIVRRIERWSIREFMRENAGLLASGRVLDFGAGDRPYRSLVRGEYIAFDPGRDYGDIQQDPATGAPCVYDAVICNQVAQYVNGFHRTLRTIYHALKPGGHLVMTFATNWDEVEDADLFRHTKTGMTMLLMHAGLDVVKYERRAEVAFGPFRFPLGYGVVAKK